MEDKVKLFKYKCKVCGAIYESENKHKECVFCKSN